MARPLAPEPRCEAALFDGDDDEPVAEWTLDELDHSADLGTMRSAWAEGDDRFE